MKKLKKSKSNIKINKVEYYPDTLVKCSCGAEFRVSSTQKTINVEVCSKCHPFYTGTQKLVDTSGRVDKFKSRLAKKEKMLKQPKKNGTVKAKASSSDKKDKLDTAKAINKQGGK